jgi:hypothetical protein
MADWHLSTPDQDVQLSVSIIPMDMKHQFGVGFRSNAFKNPYSNAREVTYIMDMLKVAQSDLLCGVYVRDVQINACGVVG